MASSNSWALATAVVALAGVAGVFVAMRGASTPAPCSDAERHLVGVWNADTEAALKKRFDALPGYGDELWVRARDRFEGYRGQWLAQHKSSCEATRVHKDQSEAAMDRSAPTRSPSSPRLSSRASMRESCSISPHPLTRALTGTPR